MKFGVHAVKAEELREAPQMGINFLFVNAFSFASLLDSCC
jgi:hypothetical protein